jgi:hypothetical protein
MNSRCTLGLRRATASSNSLFNRKADGINRNASAFPDTFTLETLLVPAEATHSPLFALCSHQERKIRSWFSITCAVSPLRKRAERHLHSFQSLPHSFQERRGRPSRPEYARRSASARPATHSNGAPQHRPGKRIGSGRCSLFAAVSLFRHIVTSSLHPEKPYLAPYHLMAKRYRTHPCSLGVYSGFRVCFRCLGLKWSQGFRVCLTNPDKRKSYLQTLS